jgi:hypothetical protein
MKGIFAKFQAIYADHKVATFPVEVIDGKKRPQVRYYQRMGLGASEQLALRFADAQMFGFMAGRRNRITVLDLDTKDERTWADAFAVHGQSPLLVRTRSGHLHAYHRWNGEQRKIRPFKGKPIDILGGGLSVAAPSDGYEIISGCLDDLDRLPVLRGLEIPLAPRNPLLEEGGPIQEGKRNTALFRHCMRQARGCDTLDDLLDCAMAFNESCVPPLDETEIVKMAKHVWEDYEMKGKNRFGRHGVYYPSEEVKRLTMDEQDAFILLSFLRANNGPKSTFEITNEGLQALLRWPEKRVAAARNKLLQLRYIKRVKGASSFSGPALYRWLVIW